MSCDRCKEDCKIEEHHLHPKYMNNPHGYAFKNLPSRVWLCRKCHTGDFGLHKTIILPLLKEYSNNKILNSEFSLWKNIPVLLHSDVIEICVLRSWRWINENS